MWIYVTYLKVSNSKRILYRDLFLYLSKKILSLFVVESFFPWTKKSKSSWTHCSVIVATCFLDYCLNWHNYTFFIFYGKVVTLSTQKLNLKFLTCMLMLQFYEILPFKYAKTKSFSLWFELVNLVTLLSWWKSRYQNSSHHLLIYPMIT